MFEGRKLLIVTKHKKEQVIAPIFEKELGVKTIVSTLIDTDNFGTFSRETERLHDPLYTVREKCKTAMRIENFDLAIASEGSFGTHPHLFFASADEEFLLLLDYKNNLEIVARELSTETNFAGTEVLTENDLLQFASKVGFPSHALILRKEAHGAESILKGITDEATLINSFKKLISLYGKAFVETDMRAMHNPTRMKIIEKTTKKLINKIKSTCPECKTPGFGVVKAISGLPCQSCGFPTKSVLSHLYSCAKCGFQKEKRFPFHKQNEDPMYCDVCNP